MYLAEDRILCWELVSKRGGAWILHYVKSAYAVTDVPDQVSFFSSFFCLFVCSIQNTQKKVPELISQRRRWLNGSFFAAVHSIVHFHYLYRSSHGFVRKAWIHVEMVYQVFNLIFSWFALVCLLSRTPHKLELMILLSLRTKKKGKLLYRLCHFIRRVGGPLVQTQRHQCRQHYPQLLLCRFTRDVFHSFAWE